MNLPWSQYSFSTGKYIVRFIKTSFLD